jgi:hypothetical protein
MMTSNWTIYTKRTPLNTDSGGIYRVILVITPVPGHVLKESTELS